MGWRDLIGASVLWVGLSAVFDGAHLIIVPALVAATVNPDMKASALGLLSFAALALAALVQPVFGALSDHSRRHLSRLGFAGAGLLGALAGLVALMSVTGFWPMAIALVVTYVSASAIQSGQQALLPELFDARRRGLASGAKQFADLAGAALAFAALAALIRIGPTPALLAVAVVLFLSYFVARVLVREPDLSERRRPDPRPRFDLTLLRGTFGRLVATRFVFLLATYAIGRFLVFLVQSRLALSATAAAATTAELVTLLTLATGISAVGWGMVADRVGRAKVSALGALLSVIGTLGMLIAADLAVIAVAGVVLALGSGAFASANWAATADAAPEGMGGRGLGVASVATWGAAACAGLLGPLVDAANVLAPGMGYVALLAVCALLFLLCVPLAIGQDRAAGLNALVAMTR